MIQATTEVKLAAKELEVMQQRSHDTLTASYGLPVLTTIASTSSSEVPSAQAYSTTQVCEVICS